MLAFLLSLAEMRLAQNTAAVAPRTAMAAQSNQ
jgi:hypothetical protein